MPSQYQPGDGLRAVTERARVHLPSCVAQRGECGCRLELVEQSRRYLLRRNGVDIEVSERDYGDSIAEYRRQRDRGLVP